MQRVRYTMIRTSRGLTPATAVSWCMAIARNQLPIAAERYAAFRDACKRWLAELLEWQRELQAALPEGETLNEKKYDAAINALESLGEAAECVSSADQWATGLVKEVKVKDWNS